MEHTLASQSRRRHPNADKVKSPEIQSFSILILNHEIVKNKTKVYHFDLVDYFVGQSEDVCNLPTEAGPCTANILRYTYNHSTGRCEAFYYGGCEGNENNFERLDDCQRLCESSYQQGKSNSIITVGHTNPHCVYKLVFLLFLQILSYFCRLRPC